jgi:hypothetical protein
MLFVIVGWVLFRARDFAVAASMLGSMTGAAGLHGELQGIKYLVAGALVSVLVPSAHELKDFSLRPNRVVAAAAAVVAIVCILQVGDGAPVSFIYFQF